MEKKIKIAIVVLICLIVMICLSAVGMYFFTDIFKTDKQMFFKYIAKNIDIVDNMRDEDLEFFLERVQNETSSNTGKMTFNAQNVDYLEFLNDINITYSGISSPKDKYCYEDVLFNVKNESTEIELLKQEDIYAIKAKDILKKYLGIENNNLKQWAKKFGMSQDLIDKTPDKIDFDKNKNLYNQIIGSNDLAQIKKTYYNFILQNFIDDMFSKSEDLENEIYTLKLSEKQFLQIYINLLETIKNDDNIQNIIKQVLSQNEVSSSDIDEVIEKYKKNIQQEIEDYSKQLNNSELDSAEEKSIFIKIFKSGKSLIKTEIVLDDITFTIKNDVNGVIIQIKEDEDEDEDKINIKMTVNKQKDENLLKYTVKIGEAYKGQEVEIYNSEILYEGLRSDNVKIKENRTPAVFNNINSLIYYNAMSVMNNNSSDKKADYNLKVYLNNIVNIKFDNNLQINKIKSSDVYLLNDNTQETLAKLFKLLYNKSEQVLQKKFGGIY